MDHLSDLSFPRVPIKKISQSLHTLPSCTGYEGTCSLVAWSLEKVPHPRQAELGVLAEPIRWAWGWVGEGSKVRGSTPSATVC